MYLPCRWTFRRAVSRLSELGTSDALFLMLVGSLSSLVPVPGGFGAFHYIVATALASVYGIPVPGGNHICDALA